MARQPAISFSISLQHHFNLAGGRASNVGDEDEEEAGGGEDDVAGELERVRRIHWSGVWFEGVKNRLEMLRNRFNLPFMQAMAEIIEDVLKLPRTERSFLAKKLLESLDADESFSAEEMREFERRSDEVRQGTVTPLTLEQFQKEVAARMA